MSRPTSRPAPTGPRSRLRTLLPIAVAVVVVLALAGGALALLTPRPAPPPTVPESSVVDTLALAAPVGTGLDAGTSLGGPWTLAGLSSGSPSREGIPLSGTGTATLAHANADVVVSATMRIGAGTRSAGVLLRSGKGGYTARVVRITGGWRLELARSTGSRLVLAEAPVLAALPAGTRLVVEGGAVGSRVFARAWVDGGDDGRVAAVVTSDSGSRAARSGGALGVVVSGGARLAALDAFSAHLTGSALPDATTEAPRTVADDGSSVADPATAGAPRPGRAEYPVPSGAIVVAPDGDDGAPGTWDRPRKTISAAVAAAHAGATIVLRGGVYHESVLIPADRALTIQAAPGESAWLDGSRRISTWTRGAGGTWTAPWSVRFDSSPTYTRGAPDSPDQYMAFLDPAHPLAAHPDQMWIDGRALRQVDPAAVVPGTFALDEARGVLVIGDDPADRDVRASDLVRAVTLRSADSALRGVGVRRYSPSVPDLGAVRCEFDRCLVEDVVVEDSATTGIFVTGTDSVVRSSTVLRSGMIGMSANYADGLRIESSVFSDNNTQEFNTAPVAGGVKITRSRDVAVVRSVLTDNDGPGVWFDESVAGMQVLRNRISGSATNGVSIEISSGAVVAGNLIVDSGTTGLKINDSDRVDVWNNTIVGGQRAVWVVQDERRGDDLSLGGRDRRRPQPDPEMPWVVGKVSLGANVLADASSCQLCVQDTQLTLSGAEMGVTSVSTVYHRVRSGAGTTVSWPIVAADGSQRFVGLSGFRSATGVDRGSVDLTGTPILSRDDGLVASAAGRIAHPGAGRPASIDRVITVPRADAVGAWGLD